MTEERLRDGGIYVRHPLVSYTVYPDPVPHKAIPKVQLSRAALDDIAAYEQHLLGGKKSCRLCGDTFTSSKASRVCDKCLELKI